MTGVSIVIVTYNGSRFLPKTLEHLAKLKIPDGLTSELLIIDNASTDETAEICSSIWEKLSVSLPMRIILEEKNGTMHARRRGILEAQFKYLLFVDDDNWLDENYLIEAIHTIQSDENIVCCGGIGIPVFEKSAPPWVHQYPETFGCGSQGQRPGDIKPKHRLYTAGLIMNNHIVKDVIQSGFQNILTGRKEGSMIAGEDTELTMFLSILGFDLWYNPKMKFMHFMPEQRMSLEYFLKLNKGHTTSSTLLIPYSTVVRKDDKGLNKYWNYVFLKTLLKYPLRILFFKKNTWKIHITKCNAKIKTLWGMRKVYASEIKRINNMKQQFYDFRKNKN